MVDFRDRVDKLLSKCTNTFGECVTYYPQRGGSYQIRGIFDNEYEAVDPETEQLISSQQPVLGVNLNDLKFEMKVKDQIHIRNMRFHVVEVKEDGQGGASLILHKCNHEEKIFKKKNSRSS